MICFSLAHGELGELLLSAEETGWDLKACF